MPSFLGSVYCHFRGISVQSYATLGYKKASEYPRVVIRTYLQRRRPHQKGAPVQNPEASSNAPDPTDVQAASNKEPKAFLTLKGEFDIPLDIRSPAHCVYKARHDTVYPNDTYRPRM